MLIFTPIHPWSYIAAAAAASTILLLLGKGAVDFFRGKPCWQKLGNTSWARLTVLLLSITTAVLFATAAMNPALVKTTERARVHLQVVIDVSDSIIRAEGGWNTVHRLCREHLLADVSALPKKLRRDGSAGILTFRSNTASAAKNITLEDLPETFDGLDTNMFATGRGTNIEAGLDGAGKRLESAGGRGAVLLVSDGNQTEGDALAAANRLASRGLPVHVLPLTAQSPALAVTAADLPRRTHARVNTFLRGVLFNRRKTDELISLKLSRNPGLSTGATGSGQFGETLTGEKNFRIPTGQWARLRWPLLFQGCGIQFLDLVLYSDKGKETHRRRFYTHVNRPPRILAIGGDNRWVTAIPGDVAEIIQQTADELDPGTSFQNIDAIVIGSVPAHQFKKEVLAAAADAVNKNGVGLMLINGGHPEGEVDAETVLMSYNDTPIEELLPVKSGPRAFSPEPPPRNVVILIDTSGSMHGANLAMAKRIARHIISNLLRPKDRLDLITFTTGAGHLIENRLMDMSGKKEAMEKLDVISASGGTDPNRALELVGNRSLNACGLIFISDGEFGNVSYRPDCRATVFAIGRSSVPKSSPLWELADPFPVDSSFDPGAITIPYFDSGPRVKFFETGTFTPLSMAHHLPAKHRVTVPELPLHGSAVSCLKDDAVLNGVRPKLTDPVLAYRKSGLALVGVFTSQIPDSWLMRTEGEKAVQEWMTRVVSYLARDRYDFKLDDRGDVLDLRISLVANKKKVPLVHRLSADIRIEKKAPVGIGLRPDEMSPGSFYGQIRIARIEQAQLGVMVIKESGPEALARSQRVPIIIPPAHELRTGNSAEDYSYGQNRLLLNAIAQAGGGLFEPAPGTPLFRSVQGTTPGNSLWMLLLAAAVLCYLLAIALQRLRRY
ncbi:MAG: VWA domain-containing protein [bacterium]|nr:VWA domain-containing protein [bacterium]